MQIIGANKEAKKTSAVLDSDGDTFLKNECKADKWLIIELSQVTKVDTLVITQVWTRPLEASRSRRKGAWALCSVLFCLSIPGRRFVLHGVWWI